MRSRIHYAMRRAINAINGMQVVHTCGFGEGEGEGEMHASSSILVRFSRLRRAGSRTDRRTYGRWFRQKRSLLRVRYLIEIWERYRTALALALAAAAAGHRDSLIYVSPFCGTSTTTTTTRGKLMFAITNRPRNLIVSFAEIRSDSAQLRCRTDSRNLAKDWSSAHPPAQMISTVDEGL